MSDNAQCNAQKYQIPFNELADFLPKQRERIYSLNEKFGLEHPTRDFFTAFHRYDLDEEAFDFVKLHKNYCTICSEFYRREFNPTTPDSIRESIFGRPHLTNDEVVFVADGTLEQPHMFKAVKHLSECRVCRRKTPLLEVNDVWARMPKYFREPGNAAVEQIIEDYYQTDPHPYFDEKVSIREKFWRLFRYGENMFFDNDWVDDRLYKTHDCLSQILSRKANYE